MLTLYLEHQPSVDLGEVSPPKPACLKALNQPKVGALSGVGGRSLPSTAKTIRYTGSKRKMLPKIELITEGLIFNKVLDAFSGSGIVSLFFKRVYMFFSVRPHLKIKFLKDLCETKKKPMIENIGLNELFETAECVSNTNSTS